MLSPFSFNAFIMNEINYWISTHTKLITSFWYIWFPQKTPKNQRNKRWHDFYIGIHNFIELLLFKFSWYRFIFWKEIVCGMKPFHNDTKSSWQSTRNFGRTRSASQAPIQFWSQTSLKHLQILKCLTRGQRPL